MKQWAVEMAKREKDRENLKLNGITIGKVINPLPEVKIHVQNEEVILDKDDIVVAQMIYSSYQNIDGTWLLAGDEVILIPSSNGQIYFLIDRKG